MLLEHTRSVIAEAEKAALAGIDLRCLLRILRQLSLDEFGEIFVKMPLATYPGLSMVLPAMASEKTQITWTGRAGMNLYPQTSQFVRCIEAGYARYAHRSLFGETILDFGCGYGRLIRMMYYFTDPENIWGVDPWLNSLNECHSVGLPANLRQSEDVPERLPVEATFSFGFSFSVFTHLTDHATRKCLSAIRKSFKSGGLFVVTVRPLEVWTKLIDSSKSTSEHYRSIGQSAIRRAETDHKLNGYGFVPHINPNVKHYGDSSFDIEFFTQQPGWEFVGYDTLSDDPHQIPVYLRAV